MNIVSSEPIPLEEVKEILKKRKKEDEALAYELDQTLENAEKFAGSSPAETRKLIEEIRKNDKIPLETAIKIVDVMPKKAQTLKTIMLKDRIELSDEEVEAVIKLLNK